MLGKEKALLQQEVSWYVASMLRQVEGYILDDVADADEPAQMRGRRQGVLVIYPQQVQVHVQK
jgi:hypothetical protein